MSHRVMKWATVVDGVVITGLGSEIGPTLKCADGMGFPTATRNRTYQNEPVSATHANQTAAPVSRWPRRATTMTPIVKAAIGMTKVSFVPSASPAASAAMATPTNRRDHGQTGY